jgi:hypothetical protein
MPLLGTAAFLAVSLPRTGERIMHLEHWGGKTAVGAINLGVGLKYTIRSTVDNLFLGTFGISGVNCPWLLLPPVLVAVAVGAWFWWRRAPDRRLILLGLAFIYGSYLLTYSARAQWSYESHVRNGFEYPGISTWSRYQLFSHLGLVLFLSAALPSWQCWFFQDWAAPAARRRRWITCLVVTRLCEAYFIVQLPRMKAYDYYDPQQQSDLRYIEQVNAICREHHISADTARAALKNLGMASFQIAGSGESDNGWNFLWGSSDPLPLSVEQAEHFLADIAGQRTTPQPE